MEILKMGIKELVTDIIKTDVKCRWKEHAEGDKRINEEYGLPLDRSNYFKMGCYECDGINHKCKEDTSNFGYLD